MAPKSVRGNRRKKVKEPSSSLKVDINFPPGRPHPDTINSLCKYQKLRPLYAVKCLPGQDYGWLARQAKTVNRIEKGFKRCCKVNRNVLKCADDKVKHETVKLLLAYIFFLTCVCPLSFCLLVAWGTGQVLQGWKRQKRGTSVLLPRGWSSWSIHLFPEHCSQPAL